MKQHSTLGIAAKMRQMQAVREVAVVETSYRHRKITVACHLNHSFLPLKRPVLVPLTKLEVRQQYYFFCRKAFQYRTWCMLLRASVSVGLKYGVSSRKHSPRLPLGATVGPRNPRRGRSYRSHHHHRSNSSSSSGIAASGIINGSGITRSSIAAG